MKKFKVIGAMDLRGAIEYCQSEINADNETQARDIFFRETRFYDVLRIEEIPCLKKGEIL